MEMSNAVNVVAGRFDVECEAYESRKNEITRNSARKSNLCSMAEGKSVPRDWHLFSLFCFAIGSFVKRCSRGNEFAIERLFTRLTTIRSKGEEN